MAHSEIKRPAVFIDRDGTINEQMGYINHIDRFKIFPFVPDAIRTLNKRGFWVIVVSNQSGVARGYFPISLVHKVHEYLREALKREGAYLDDILFCPHYPNGKIPEYSKECSCRKPRPGLIRLAQKRFPIDMESSYVIGDRYTDIELAKRCNLKGILVKTGYGLGDIEYVFPYLDIKPDYVAVDLKDAVKWIITQNAR